MPHSDPRARLVLLGFLQPLAPPCLNVYNPDCSEMEGDLLGFWENHLDNTVRSALAYAQQA